MAESQGSFFNKEIGKKFKYNKYINRTKINIISSFFVKDTLNPEIWDNYDDVENLK